MSRLDGDFARRCAGLCRGVGGAARQRFLAPPSLPRRAAGSEPSGLADYTCGDDYRYVDWNRAARLDELVSRQYYGSERGRVWMLLDVSASMEIGQPAKLDAGRQLAAALGYACLARHDELGAAAFGAAVGPWLRPCSGAAAAATYFRFLEGLGPQAGRTDLRAAARWLEPRCGAASQVVLVSDLLDPAGFAEPLGALRRRGCGIHVIQLYAAEDARPTRRGPVRLEDVETADWLSAIIEASDLANYQAVFQEFCLSVRQFCAGRGLACTQLCSTARLAEAFAAVQRGSSRSSTRRVR